MATKKYDLAVKVGSYEKNGQTKNRYVNVGALIEGERGPYLLMDRYFNAAGIPNPDNRANVIISLFEPKPSIDTASQSDFGERAYGTEDVPF